MKTRYRFIHFEKPPTSHLWHCYASAGQVELGFLEYHYPWKQWQFVPSPETAFTTDCLRDIASFIGQLPKPA